MGNEHPKQQFLFFTLETRTASFSRSRVMQYKKHAKWKQFYKILLAFSKGNSNLCCVIMFCSWSWFDSPLLILYPLVSDLSQYQCVANRHEYQRRWNTKSKAAFRSIFTLLSTATLGYITCAQKQGASSQPCFVLDAIFVWRK